MGYTTPFISAAQQRNIIDNANIAVARFAKSYADKLGFKRLFNREDIEDIAGNVICKACRSFSSYDPSKGKLSTWVSRIAVNCVIDAVDYKIKHLPISQEIFVENSENGEEFNAYEVCDERSGFIPEVWDLLCEHDAESDLGSKEIEARLREERAKMSEKNQRFLIWLEEGYAPKDMAAMEGCTPNAAAKRVFVIRQALKESLGDIAEESGFSFRKYAC